MAELATLERRRLALFATGCAGRARPVAAACGSPATADGFGETLEALWAGEGRLLAGPAAELLVLYDDAPENSAESSEESAYWAMSGVSLLAAALNAASPDGPDVAGWVCSGSINLHRGVDGIFNPVPPGTRIDTRGMPPPGQWETAEVAAQRECLSILRSQHPSLVLTEQIRDLSEAQAGELAPVMPRFLILGGWAPEH